jgi:hypothetical protein
MKQTFGLSSGLGVSKTQSDFVISNFHTTSGSIAEMPLFKQSEGPCDCFASTELPIYTWHASNDFLLQIHQQYAPEAHLSTVDLLMQ